MGLDMYLSKRTYVKNWEHTPDEKRYEITIKRGGQPVSEHTINTARITEIVEEVGYWRKANQIHNWFIDNCADGDHNRYEMEVSREQLKDLKTLCEKVLTDSKLVKGKIKNGQTYQNGEWIDNLQEGKYIENPETAEMLLPTQPGFFFGSTDYDEWYIKDLKHTVDIINDCLKYQEGYFNYYASW
jgi:hypothetical protein